MSKKNRVELLPKAIGINPAIGHRLHSEGREVDLDDSSELENEIPQ